MSQLVAERTALVNFELIKPNVDPARAKIVCLPAGHRGYPQIDCGEYYALRDRFHLILQGQEGSWLKAGDEQLEMRTG